MRFSTAEQESVCEGGREGEREDYNLEWCRIACVTFRRLYRLFPVEEVNGKLK